MVEVRSAALRDFFSRAKIFSSAEVREPEEASEVASGMRVSTSVVKSASCFFSGADMVDRPLLGEVRSRGGSGTKCCAL